MEKALEKNPSCAAMAGIASVYYVDIDNVQTFQPKTGGVRVTLKSGKRWMPIEADEAKAGSTHETPMAWRHRVELLYHGNQQGVTEDLVEMTQRRFLVKAVDNNGTEWILGHTESPLRFSHNSENDGEADGETAYRLTFESMCPLPEMALV